MNEEVVEEVEANEAHQTTGNDTLDPVNVETVRKGHTSYHLDGGLS